MDDALDELEPDGSALIGGFEFDELNLPHLAAKNIDESRIERLARDAPVMVANRPGRAAGHLLIAQDFDNRIWTVAMLLVEPERHVWRPITGWPSVRKEVAAWESAN